MDFGWNESALRVHPRCDPGGTKVKNRWIVNETLAEIKWGYKCNQYFFISTVVNNQARWYTCSCHLHSLVGVCLFVDCSFYS